MEPKIIEKGQMLLLGFSFYGDPFSTSAGWTEENEIGRLWQRFMTYLEKNAHRIKHVTNSQVCYEVHLETEETAQKGHYEVFVGLEIDRLEDVPVQVLLKTLPPTTYAVFTLEGQQITSDWPNTIYRHWLPGSGYQAGHSYMVQVYDQRFKGLDKLDESVMDVLVPIQKAGPPAP